MCLQWNFAVAVSKFFGVKNLSIHEWPLSTKTAIFHCYSRPTIGKLARIMKCWKKFGQLPKDLTFQGCLSFTYLWNIFLNIIVICHICPFLTKDLTGALGCHHIFQSPLHLCKKKKKKFSHHAVSQIVHIWPVSTTNLGLWCIEGDGLCWNACP